MQDILDAKAEAAAKLMETVLKEQQKQTSSFNQMFEIFKEVTFHNLDIQESIKKDLASLKVSKAVDDYSIDALHTKMNRMEELLKDLKKPQSDDAKKGEKKESTTAAEDEHTFKPRPTPKFSNKRKIIIGYKKLGKALSVGSSHKESDSDVEEVAKPEAEASMQPKEPQAEKPMPDMPKFTKASQAETEAAIPEADPVIRAPSPVPNDDDLPISSLFKKKQTEDDIEDDDSIYDEEIVAEEMPKLPSLETIINDARMAGATPDDIEKLKVTYARALSLGVTMVEMMEIEDNEREVRLAEEKDAESRKLAKSLAIKERDDLTSADEKTKLDPYQAQKRALEIAKKASQDQQAEAERQRLQREAEAKRALDRDERHKESQAARYQERVENRYKDEKITKVLIKKLKDHVTPSMTLHRAGRTQWDMVIDLIDIMKLGYSEWVEIHQLAQHSSSKHKDRVLDTIGRMFVKAVELNVDFSKLKKPLPLSDEQRDATKPVKRSRNPKPYVPVGPSESLIDQMLTKGGDMTRVNLTPPPDSPQDVEGLFIEVPESGLLYHDHKGILCFQRTSQLQWASPVHLFLLRCTCNRHPVTSANFIEKIEAEAKRRNLNLDAPDGLYIKEAFLHLHTQQ
jgi:hypothetical protein